MLISINDIRNSDLTKSMMGGYKIEDVDALLNEICETLEMHEKQKGELTRKLKILGDRVEQYRADEQMIKNALYDAQRKKIEAEDEAKLQSQYIVQNAEKKADEVKIRLQKEIQNALAQAKEIKAKAQWEADEIIRTAQRERDQILRDVERSKLDFVAIQDKIVGFRNELIEKYKEHLHLIASLPSKESTKMSAEEMEKLYPTSRTSHSGNESKPSNSPEIINDDEDIDAMIQRTLEFDVETVKKAVEDSKSVTDKLVEEQYDELDEAETDDYYPPEDIDDVTPDEAKEDTAQIPPEAVAPSSIESRARLEDRHRTKVVRAGRRGRVSFTSRTVEASKQENTEGDMDDTDTIKIVDVDPKELDRDKPPRASRFF